MTKPLTWTGGAREFTGTRGNWLVAKIVCDGDSYSVYDQRYYEGDGLGPLAAAGISLDEAKKRAEELR